jgi:hypothetical protein
MLLEKVIGEEKSANSKFLHFFACNGIPRVSFPRNSRNSVVNNHLFRLFRLPRNYFLSEIPNPIPGTRVGLSIIIRFAQNIIN